MTEIISRDGTWSMHGAAIRITHADNRRIHMLPRLLGEVTVPLEAVSDIVFEPERKGGGWLRLRLREGADPLLSAAGGRLPAEANPYSLALPKDRVDRAEAVVSEIRASVLENGMPRGAVDRYLLPGPSVPLTLAALDGTAEFDGEVVRIEWGWGAEESKTSAGVQEIPVGAIKGVDWDPGTGLDYGQLRFRAQDEPSELAVEHDPWSLVLWGFKKEGWSSLLMAAAVLARLPHR